MRGWGFSGRWAGRRGTGLWSEDTFFQLGKLGYLFRVRPPDAGGGSKVSQRPKASVLPSSSRTRGLVHHLG